MGLFAPVINKSILICMALVKCSSVQAFWT
jgi:hypothetical protein